MAGCPLRGRPAGAAYVHRSAFNMTRKKVSLSPRQCEIVWLLEEAGEENLATLLNTLGNSHPDESREEIYASILAATQGLVRMGYVNVSQRLSSLTERDFGDRGVEVTVMLTDNGRRMLTQ